MTSEQERARHPEADTRPNRDFFISYANEDRVWAEWVAWVLEEEGYWTILQAWDFVAGSNFVVEMNEACQIAARTITILSPAYLSSNFTPSEWTEAFADDPKGDKRKLLPIRVAECNVTGLLKQIVWVDLVGCTEGEGREKLLGAAREKRLKPSVRPGFPGGATRQVPSEPAFPANRRKTINVPRRNVNFTGRGDTLAAMHSALTQAHKGSITQPQAITGLGGVGKTQLAIEYAHHYMDQYTLIGWIHAEEEESVLADLSAVGLVMDLEIDPTTPPAEMIADLHKALSTRDDWLLVFDNAEDPAKLNPYLPPPGTGHAIITSRNPNWRSVAKTIDVAPFDREDSIRFLLKRTQRARTDGADAVAQAVGDLPLALEQAGAYIEQTKMSFRQYARLFEDRHKDLWQSQEPPDQYHATVATTWDLALEKLQTESPGSIALLKLSSFLAPEEIPIFLLIKGAEELPEPLAEVAADEVALRGALVALSRFGLSELTTRGYSVHRLVQAVLRDALDLESQVKWVTVSISVLTQVYDFQQNNPSTWPMCTELLPHVTAATSQAEKLGISLEEVGQLLNDAGACLWNLARFQLAHQYITRALRIDERVFGKEHPTIASRVNNLGRVLQDLGRLEDAREAYERALRIDEAVYGASHPKTAIIVSNLGVVLQDLGKLEEAREAFERSLAIDEAAYGPHHPSVGIRVNNLGGVLHELGKLEEAKTAYERALSIDRAEYGSKHPAIARDLNNLGLVLQDLGMLGKAREACEQALKIGEEFYGPNHPKTGAYVNNVGLVLRSLGKFNKAKAAFERAREIDEATYGSNHPEVATDLYNLGSVLRKLGKLDDAKAAYERALRIDEDIYGKENPTVARDVNSLGLVLRSLGRLEEAKVAFERALSIDEAVYGPNHSKTAIRVNGLGLVLKDLGQLEAAKEACTRALKISVERYGFDHPDVAKYICDLCAVLQELQKPARGKAE